MPELPEVETMRRGIRPVVGARITRVAFPRSRLKPISVLPRPATFRRRVVGRSIVGTNRVGKRVVVRLENQDSIVFEPRMTGLVLVVDPPDDRYLRCRLSLSGGDAQGLFFWDRRGLGSVRLLSPSEFAHVLGPERVGPDALSVTAAELQQRFRGGRREIKVALLDQRALAGIGNLYASEILHVARIHPQRRCDQLNRRQWERLYAAMQHVLREAIRYEGSTLADGTYRNALNRDGTYQNCHRVYNRGDQMCPSCRRRKVVRIVQAQRSTFFCPRCQRAP
jgi:formamidopyrimidine-DNA glycosylase